MNAITPRVFTASVVVGAAATVGTLSIDGLAASAPLLAALALLAGAVGSRSVRVPGTGLTVSAIDVFVFVALAGIAPMGAPLVALAGTLGAVILSQRRPSVHRAILNLAAVPAAAAAVSWAAIFTVRTIGNGPAVRALILLLGAVLYLGVNLALVATAVALEGRRGFFATVAGAGPWTLVSTVVCAVVAVGVDALMKSLGAPAVLFGLALVPPITAYFREHVQEPAPSVASVSPSPLAVGASPGRVAGFGLTCGPLSDSRRPDDTP